ncbi:MAG: hypothetical protein QMC38_02140, partial [Sinobacterium sp.]
KPARQTMFFIQEFVRLRRSMATSFKSFKVVSHTSLMIGTQSRLPCRAVQLGEAVLLKNPVSPYEIHQIIGEHKCEGKSKASAALRAH